jgi:glycosyltransferase involved in cell wall biosynthesis
VSIVLDLSHTAHCPAQTGVQRVCRQLWARLAATSHAPAALIFDRYARRWRMPDATESALLSLASTARPGRRRGETWTLPQKLRGCFGRGAEPDWAALRGTPLLAPEIFTTQTFAAYRALRAHLGGPAGAVFHDAVALRHPELTPPASVARFPAYLRELATFDGIAANSAASRAELLDHWSRLGLRDTPPVAAIPLGVDSHQPLPSPPATDPRGPLILSVGTIEGRKNHLALLEAAEILWREGRHFRLCLAGLPRPETAGPALRRAAELQAAGRPLETPGAVSESRLRELYAVCRFTVYPSLYEGFGLPVAESLSYGRPCVCGSGGALAEIAAGGGALLVPEPTATHLADAIRALLEDDALCLRLGTEAAQRRFHTWDDYARNVAAWLSILCPRPQS